MFSLGYFWILEVHLIVNMTSENVVIRAARPEDCGEILRMIKELAVYEQMAEKATLTEESLREDAFGDHPYYRALVAETSSGLTEETSLIGYAMYYFCYCPWLGRGIYLEDFYVEPAYRGRGIGTSIMREVAKIGVKHRCNKMQWVCLNWNDVAIDFYKKHGSKDVTVDEKWHLFRMDREELAAFAGRGIGTSLMKEVAKIGVENHCNMMQWACLSWNEIAVRFYKRHGAKNITEEGDYHLFRMDRQELVAFTNSV